MSILFELETTVLLLGVIAVVLWLALLAIDVYAKDKAKKRKETVATALTRRDFDPELTASEKIS
jgi:hypothetical protein